VVEVRALSVRRLLGYTPDLYDAHLTWTNGLVLRIKAEWIRHMEPLVEHRFTLSGATGGWVTVGNGFQTEPGWQATLDPALSLSDLADHQARLRAMGVYAKAVLRRPHDDIEGPGARPALEVSRKFLTPYSAESAPELRDHIVQAIRDGVEVPASWTGGGRLPTGEDGLEQTRVVTAIVRAAETGAVIQLRGAPPSP
jgi:hypothetical protein